MNVFQFTEAYHRLTLLWHVKPPASEREGGLARVVENHRQNFLLWHEEDLAPRDDLPPERIREALREFYLKECNAAVPQCLRPALVAVEQQAGRTAERQSGGAALPSGCGKRLAARSPLGVAAYCRHF